MNWISRFKKIGIKVKQIIKKQPTTDQQETDWKNCPQCKKISYLPDLISNLYICECTFHFDLPPKLRLDNLFDSTYKIIEPPDNINPDPLQYPPLRLLPSQQSQYPRCSLVHRGHPYPKSQFC